MASIDGNSLPTVASASIGAREFFGPHKLARRWKCAPVTIHRHERQGLLPPRDARLGTRTGWWGSTIEQVEARS